MVVRRPSVDEVPRAAGTDLRAVVVAFGRELGLVVTAAAVYVLVRALTEGSAAEAVANGERVLELERRLGIAWEASWQAAVLDHDRLVTLANWVYLWGHWPVIGGVALVLWLRCRPAYRELRTTVLLSGLAGFLFFALFPVAPPRLLPDPVFVDTVADRSASYRTLQPPALTNQYAAFPSLHFGWNLLVGIVLFRASRSTIVRAFAVVMPVAMALAIVVTANHYVIDAPAGALLALGALALVRARLTPSPTLGGDAVAAVRRPGAPRPPLRRRPPERQRPHHAARGRVARRRPRRG